MKCTSAYSSFVDVLGISTTPPYSSTADSGQQELDQVNSSASLSLAQIKMPKHTVYSDTFCPK
jgi:hypothetical protein